MIVTKGAVLFLFGVSAAGKKEQGGKVFFFNRVVRLGRPPLPIVVVHIWGGGHFPVLAMCL